MDDQGGDLFADGEEEEEQGGTQAQVGVLISLLPAFASSTESCMYRVVHAQPLFHVPSRTCTALASCTKSYMYRPCFTYQGLHVLPLLHVLSRELSFEP
eukprot:1149729-Pelagomonas_calceolata.AAC.4